MEEVKITLDEANKLFRQADHLVYVTYPLLQETKLIITISENLSKSLILAMDALLCYERLYKRIPLFPENFESRFDIFKRKVASRYSIDRDHLVLINDLRKLVDARKGSNMEFIRKEKYVLMNSNFGTKTITIGKLKDYLEEGKSFMNKINGILKNA